jgi:hypothetical protein
MHFAPLLGLPWAEYLEAMREGVRKLRAGAGGHLRDDDRDG